MKAKKLIVGMAVFSFAALLLGGCGADDNNTGSSSTSESTSQTSASDSATTESSEATVVAGEPMQDGTYRLEEKNYKNDYRVTFEITVKDGKIVESKYDNVNADGESKTENTEYNETMKEKAGISPEEFIPKFNEELVAAQSPSSIEVVSGATHSFDSFQNYAQQLIQAAQAGNTETIEIDNGADLKDGTYTLEEKNYSNGYRVHHTTKTWKQNLVQVQKSSFQTSMKPLFLQSMPKTALWQTWMLFQGQPTASTALLSMHNSC